MKDSWEWEESDLLSLVNARTQESIELDFKESASLQNSDKKKDEISKDVSAFANSAGGTLVYGVKEDKITHVATGVDTGSDPNDITKEWIEQVINSKIHQRIDGIRIKSIELKTSNPGRYAYVVYVPSSLRAPHQASDKRFYKRFNFQSVPMEEYEIRDVARRREVPDLRIEFAIPKTEIIPIAGTTEFEPISLQVVITNDAIEPADYAIVQVFIDARLVLTTIAGGEVNRNLSIVVGTQTYPITMVQVNWGTLAKMPIFYARFNLLDALEFKVPSDGRMGKTKYFLLGYSIKSPRMSEKTSFAILELRAGNIRISDQGLTPDEVLINQNKILK